MFDGLAGRSVAHSGRALVVTPAVPAEAAQRDRGDQTAAATRRPTQASAAAVVRLSKRAAAVMERGRGPPPPGERYADLLAAGNEAPPPAPQRQRPPSIVNVALARYRQVAYDPASSFVSSESPFRRPGKAEAPAPMDSG
ncbi:MAG: hypothetical protein JKY37_10140 [Nannocystaceae bacterium]|nr:hypothetical protein [Nannocystaceae bacterium]